MLFLLSVVVSDDFLLVCVQTQHLALLLGSQTLEVTDSGVHLCLQHGQQGVVLVGHCSVSDT